MSFDLGRTTIPYERQTAASCGRVPVSQRQPGPSRQRRAALRTLAAPSPAGSTLTTSTFGPRARGQRALDVAERPPDERAERAAT